MSSENRSTFYIAGEDATQDAFVSILKNVTNLNQKMDKMQNDTNENNAKVNKSFAAMGNLTGAVSKGMFEAAKKAAMFAIAITGVTKTVGVLKDNIAAGLEFNLDVSKAEKSLQGVILSTQNFTDAAGKPVEGIEKFRVATQLAQSDMNKLKLEAIKTGQSFTDLSSVFTSSLNEGLQNKFKREDVRKLASTALEAGGAIGLDASQVSNELKAILGNNITDENILAKSLGLGAGGSLDEAYKKALKAGEGFEFLKKKMGELKSVGDEQKKSLKDITEQFGNFTKAFAGESVKGLEQSLSKITEPFKKLFNEDTGNFAKELEPIIAMFNVIGEIVGEHIVGSFNFIVDLVKEVGVYLEEDQTLLNTALNVVESIQSVFGKVAELVQYCYGIFVDIVDEVLKLSGESEEVVNKTNSLNKVLLLVNKTVGALRIGFTLIIDAIKVAGDTVRLVLGGAIEFVTKGLVGFMKYISKVFDTLNMTSAKEAVDGFARDAEASMGKVVKRIEGVNNIYLDPAKNVLNELFGDATKEAEKFSETYEKGMIKTNERVTKTLNDLRKKNALPEITESSLGLKTTTRKNINGGGSDALKKEYEENMKIIQRFLEKEKAQLEIRNKYLELDKQFNLVSVSKYYTDLQKIQDDAHKVEITALDKQISLTKKYSVEAKSIEETKAANDELNKLYDEREKIILNYTFEHKKNSMSQIKDLKDYSNAVLDLDAQIAELTGKYSSAEKIKLQIEIEGLNDQFKADPEALKKVANIQKLKEEQLLLNNVTRDFYNILDMQSALEESINLRKQAGFITEYDQLIEIGELRKKNIPLLEAELEKLTAIQKIAASPEVALQIQQITNELNKARQATTPLYTELKESFKTGLTDSLTNALAGVESLTVGLNKMFDNLHQRLLKLAAEKALQQIGDALANTFGLGNGKGIAGMFGSGASQGMQNIGSILGLAGGGGYDGGLRLVGEKGPELLKTNKPGQILNNVETEGVLKNGLGNSSQIINVYMDVNGVTNPNEWNQSKTQILSDLSVSIRNAANKNL